MNKLSKWTIYLLATVLAGTSCTDEVQQAGNGEPLPGGDDDALRREVTLNLKNKLVVPQAGTKAGTNGAKAGSPETKAIATAEENYIRSLDVYVFGSETENGVYTFQELFYYRDDASLRTETWAKNINLTTTDDNTTALLKLSKGLFVKIYCVANRTHLFGTDDAGTVTEYTAFQALAQSAPGQAGNTVTPGLPTETDFLALHTRPIEAAGTTDDDILATPLTMAGSYTTPLDLTDFDNSARTQMSFKLTRLAARFDVINDAATSKFTVQSIAMGQARKGASLFPIRPLGTQPAVNGDLLTSPARAFDGKQANTGLQPGAFYCYPSPKEDAGYIILKGTYAVNQTQSKEVTYQIPFKPSDADEGSFLEVAYNHRYTIAITDADLYHLDFTLTVADWADDGSIDEYTPGDEVDASVKVDIATDPDGKVVFDETTNTVTMPVSATSTFDLSASQGLSLTKSYIGTPEDQQYDWLVVSEPVATKAATEGNYKYTFSINKDYHGTNFPVALLRFKNTATGKSQLMRIAPETTPTVTTGQTYTLAAAPNLTVPSIDITVDCAQGSTITGPDWLTYDKTEATTASATYRVSLVPNLDGFPTALPTDQTITIANKAKPELKTDVTVSFTDAPRMEILNSDFDLPGNIKRVTTAGKTITVSVTSMFQPTVTSTMDAAFGEGNTWLPQPSAAATRSELKNNRCIYTCDIVIPASTGTDAAYQVHKGKVSAKVGSSSEIELTVYRGASTVEYPTKGFDGTEGGSPYYSAVKVGDNWWAPLNIGAYEVAAPIENIYSVRKYVGNFYQWGRKTATYYGSKTTIAGPVANADATDEFISASGSSTRYDWLQTRNDNLWVDSKAANNPCPEGWRVPSNTQLETWNVDGYTFADYILTIPGANSIDLLVPTTGYRAITGNFAGSTYGFYWSSMVNSDNAIYVKFATAYVDINYGGKRAEAYAVRCIKE